MGPKSMWSSSYPDSIKNPKANKKGKNLDKWMCYWGKFVVVEDGIKNAYDSQDMDIYEPGGLKGPESMFLVKFKHNCA